MAEIKPPKLERSLGIEVYLSKSNGIGGRIKVIPEDFLVEEITTDGRILKVNKNSEKNEIDQIRGEYIHFTLQKRNWDTIRAIREISKRLRISYKRFGYAGMKDKNAITTQRVSVRNGSIEDLMRVKIKDISMKNFEYADEGINLGDLKGNRFTVTIRDSSLDENQIEERINSIIRELRIGIPNFFGIQRFGAIRPITHLVGKEILNGNPEKAVMIYLTEVFENEDEESKRARKFLRENRNFREAIKLFPKYLGYENAMLNFLVKNPTNFSGALRKLPKKLRLMFVHAYQSYLFNKALSEYIRRNIVVERLPLVGYETEIDEVTSEILEKEGISKEDFARVKDLASKGRYRECFTQVNDFRIIKIEDGIVVVQFSLSKGSYATIFLRELMKCEWW